MALFKKKAKDEKKKEKIKLTKEERKLLKKQQKMAKKRRSRFTGQKGFVSEKGFIEFDGYVRLGEDGDYITIYDVLVKYGTHNPETIGWLTQLLPTNALNSGNIWFGLHEKGIGKKTEETIFTKTITSRRSTMANLDESKDVREQSKRQLEQNDVALAIQLSKDENIVDSDVVLVVKAKTPELLEKTVSELRQNYKDDGIDGFTFVRKTSRILDSLLNVFVTLPADVWHNSDVQTVSATRLFLPSSGFSDEEGGVYCGNDMHSFIADNPAMIDFSMVRNAVIMTGGVRGVVSVNGIEGGSLVSNYGSAWSHIISEDNWLQNGTRTHFINLVEFNYHRPNSKVFDMDKHTINSLEVQGTKATVKQDANANFNKVTEIMMLLLGDDEPDPVIKTTLKKTLTEWVIHRAGGGSGLYTTDPDRNPTDAWKILATVHHENYPTLSDFIAELQSLVAGEAKKGERARMNADRLYDSLLNATRLYPNIFKAKTDIPDSFSYEDRNIYYDLDKIGEQSVRSATFLNVLAYVTNRANPGDMIVINGLDSVNVDPRVLKPYRDKMDKKGLGLIVTFEDRENEDVNVETMSKFVHPLVTQDLVVIGGMSEKSLANIQASWGRNLPAIVQDDLMQNLNSQYYVYRSSDFGNAVIDAHLIL